MGKRTGKDQETDDGKEPEVRKRRDPYYCRRCSSFGDRRDVVAGRCCSPLGDTPINDDTEVRRKRELIENEGWVYPDHDSRYDGPEER